MPHDDKSAAHDTSAARDGANPDARPAVATRRISSVELLGEAREIEIEHNGRRYQLRITQTGKLILTA